MSIDRYLFIHHQRLIKHHTIALHYVRLYTCSGTCYALEPHIGLFNWICHSLCTETIILTVDSVVITRYLIQRRRMESVIATVDARRPWASHTYLKDGIREIHSKHGSADRQDSSRNCDRWVFSTLWFGILIQTFRSSEQLGLIFATCIAYIPCLQSLLLP